jgi:soluble lytic murein transglycosylase
MRSKRWWLVWGFICGLVSILPVAHGRLVTDEEVRETYQAALKAARAGDIRRYRKLSEELQGYVLRPYVDYEYLKERLDSVPTSAVRQFLDDAAAAPVSDMLRAKWLRRLAARGEWTEFLRDYRPIENDTELACMRLERLLRSSEQQAALMQEVSMLWRTGKRLSPACEPVFAAWRAAGHMTADEVWTRIRLAMERRNTSLAKDLSRYLEPSERVWVTRWIAMHRNPVAELDSLRYPVETPIARMIVRHGVVRLAYRDPEAAMERWENLKQEYLFLGEDENYVLRNVGILAAQAHLPQALKWLTAVSADASDENLHLWRVRAALRAGDWQSAKRFVAALTEEQQQEPQWRYWNARILEETGRRMDAKAHYRALALERGYYGFLAADRIGSSYSMQHESVEAKPEEVNAILARTGIQMARELYLQGQITEARRQWQYTTNHMNNRELAVAAVVAREWGWYDRAILTVAKSDFQDDLELRFPVLYRDLIEENAQRHGIDTSWVYGIVRQESAFVPDARSPVGALGLMQLMPATGRLTARRLKIPARSTHAILDIENNLRLGTGYLRQMLDRYAGNQVLATASYNAGPNRIVEWLEDDEVMDAEVWVETIPYNETRNYVKNVLAYTAVYEHRLNEQQPVRLRQRMPEVSLPAR